MDAKLLFWTLAFANFGVITACALVGVRRIRARDVRGHQRMMGLAGLLVLLFLVAYVGKVIALGREDRSQWSSLDFTVLWVHETCIAVMLAAGLYAAYRALRFRARLGPGPSLPPDDHPLQGRVVHRRAGWAAVVGCTLAFVTAAGVLFGMFSRVG